MYSTEFRGWKWNEMQSIFFLSSTTGFAWVWALAKTVNDVVLIVAYDNNTF